MLLGSGRCGPEGAELAGRDAHAPAVVEQDGMIPAAPRATGEEDSPDLPVMRHPLAQSWAVMDLHTLTWLRVADHAERIFWT